MMEEDQQASAPGLVSGPQDEAPPETTQESPEQKAAPEILSPDQQAVMHRISEAIAMLIYNEKANGPIMDMAEQGPDGVVKAVGMVVSQVAQTAKPGVPRELLPMAALAALMLINDFLERTNQKPADLREVLPKMIDHLGNLLQATPMEMAQMRRIKAKFNRAEDRKSLMQRAAPEAGEGPPEEENAEVAATGADTDSAAEGEY